MAGPQDIGIVDLELGIAASEGQTAGEAVRRALEGMDRHGIERALLPVSLEDKTAQEALRRHPDRFLGRCAVDPNRGMEALRLVVRMREELGVAAVSAFPAACRPPLPIDDKRFFPLYAKCAELDLPLFLCVGLPGPPLPMAVQSLERVDEVCWSFPELRLVMRGDLAPWSALAVKLLGRWPKLSYATSGVAPLDLPAALIDYANAGGADKLLYGGDLPGGLPPQRIRRELARLPLHAPVWPKLLRENALRLLRLEDAPRAT